MSEFEDVLEAKKTLVPAMDRTKGKFECMLCDFTSKVDGNCPNDTLPLRKVPVSEQ